MTKAWRQHAEDAPFVPNSPASRHMYPPHAVHHSPSNGQAERRQRPESSYDRGGMSDAQRRALPALGLAVAVVAVYALSLRGGFLNYDDDWLVPHHPGPAPRGPPAPPTIWAHPRA